MLILFAEDERVCNGAVRRHGAIILVMFRKLLADERMQSRHRKIDRYGPRSLERLGARGSWNGQLWRRLRWGRGYLLTIESHLIKRGGSFLSQSAVRYVIFHSWSNSDERLDVCSSTVGSGGRDGVHDLVQVLDYGLFVGRICRLIELNPRHIRNILFC